MQVTKRSVTMLAALGLISWLGAGAAQAKDWTTVRIGTDASYPPFESVNPKGDIVGFEVDYGNALCKKVGVTCTFQNQDWDGIIPALLGGKFDMILSGMNITEERKKRVIFTEMYLAVPPVWATQATTTSNDISPAALKGKTIGTQSSSVHAHYLERLYKDSEIKLYPTQDEPNLDLASGRIDYVVGDGIVEQDFIDKKGNGCCRIVAKITRLPDIHGPGVGMAFRPDDADLRDRFNKAIDELDADGTFKTLAAKYFKDDIRGK